jgi:hypothetical protein
MIYAALAAFAAIALVGLVYAVTPRSYPQQSPLPRRYYLDTIVDAIYEAPKDKRGDRILRIDLAEGETAWNPNIDPRTMSNQTRGPCKITYRMSESGNRWIVDIERPGSTIEQERAETKAAWERIHRMRRNPLMGLGGKT